MRDKFPEVSQKVLILVGMYRCFVATEANKCTLITNYYVFQVIINFPDPAQKSDIVQLRGPRTEVEKCSKFMQKIVAEMVYYYIVLYDSIYSVFCIPLLGYFVETFKCTFYE